MVKSLIKSTEIELIIEVVEAEVQLEKDTIPFTGAAGHLGRFLPSLDRLAEWERELKRVRELEENQGLHEWLTV